MNGRIDFHGQHHKCSVLQLRTDQGATGWGLSGKTAEVLAPRLQGKTVAELITPGRGIAEGLDRTVDFALHDLMGVILGKPVYELLGANCPKENIICSGMRDLENFLLLNPAFAKFVGGVRNTCSERVLKSILHAPSFVHARSAESRI